MSRYTPPRCATDLPSVSTYSGAGGWSEGRLGQAYDLIDAIIADQHPESEVWSMLTNLRGLIEDADIEIGASE
jgi:hypothetical protein